MINLGNGERLLTALDCYQIPCDAFKVEVMLHLVPSAHGGVKTTLPISWRRAAC